MHEIVFDDAQRLVVVYHVGTGALWVARCQDAACDAVTTEPLNVGGLDVDLELDSLGNPVIVSSSSSARTAVLTRCADPTCQESSSRTVATNILTPSVQVDSNDLPVVVYWDIAAARAFLTRCGDPGSVSYTHLTLPTICSV